MSYFDLRITQIPVFDANTTPIDPTRASETDESYPQKFILEINDNGTDGDGCRLDVFHADKRINDTPVCTLWIADNSLPVVIAALNAVVQLREAQNKWR